MKCPKDYYENFKTLYKDIFMTSDPSFCFDTSKIDPIKTKKIEEDESFLKTCWFLVVEECQDQPECASPEEIKSYVDSHMIWSTEYGKFVDAKN